MVAKHCATEHPKPHQTKEDEVRENMKIANAKSTRRLHALHRLHGGPRAVRSRRALL